MKKGLVDLDIFRDNKEKANYHGKSAYCFKLNNSVLKVYADFSDKEFSPIDRGSVVDLSKYKSSVIIFPSEYIYENGVISGEISRFVPDRALDDAAFNNNVRLLPLLRNYREAVLELKKFDFIDMFDLCTCNITYSGKNGFHIYDTTEWKYRSDEKNMNIYRFDSSIVKELLNYLEFPQFLHWFIDTKMPNNILNNDYGNLGKEFYEAIMDNLMDSYNVEDFINLFMKMYQKYYDREMKTLSDMKKYTKILKK